MSSILKALKKLEHEKTGRLPSSLKLNTDILTTVDSSRSFSPFASALLFLLIFGVGAAVAFFFMKETKEMATTKPQPVIAAKSLQASISAPVLKPETIPAEIVVVPARNEASGEAPRKQQQKKAVEGNTADSIVKKPAKQAVSGLTEKLNGATEAVKREHPAAATTIPTLRVNGIAFQNSGADSMAIVNGMPVSSGSIIEGITVEEVRSDRVLFQHNGEKFEIQLGQSNR